MQVNHTRHRIVAIKLSLYILINIISGDGFSFNVAARHIVFLRLLNSC